MDAKQIAKFEALLHKRRDELRAIEDSGAQAAATVELDQTRMGRLSRMDALQGQAMSVEGRRRRELELQKITAALARIEQGEFGDCLECGEAINPLRLELDPSAQHCVRCAEKMESNIT